MAQPKNLRDFNCGGYALRNNEWYCPYMNDEEGYAIWNYIWDLENEGCSQEEILDLLIKSDVDCILNDFPELEVVRYENIDWSKRAIAYRVMYLPKDAENEMDADHDFHFKYWNGKTWSEKMGGGNIHHCELNKDNVWEYSCSFDYLEYNGEIIYFQKKERKEDR